MGQFEEAELTVFTTLLRDHALDWATVALLAAVIGIASNDEWCPPFHKLFLPKNGTLFDPSLNYPNVESSVNSTALALISIGIPTAMAILTQVVNLLRKDGWDWKLDVHAFALSFAESITISQVMTFGLKKFAGRQRPDFYALLEGGDQAAINDGMNSYPSGHSSLAFTGMTFIALYLCGKLKVVGGRHRFAAFALVGYAPLSIAALVATSRTRDYKHNYADINAGAWIGFVASLACYSLNYRPLSDAKADIPYSYLDREDPERTYQHAERTYEHLEPIPNNEVARR